MDEAVSSFDKAFDVLVNGQTLLFCLGVYVVTYFIRTVVEALWKGAKTSTLWYELFLPLGPICTGVILALSSKAFPFPMEIAETAMGRLMYGGVCGLMSGWIYNRLRTWLKIAADKENPVAMKMLGRKPTEPPPPPASEQ